MRVLRYEFVEEEEEQEHGREYIVVLLLTEDDELQNETVQSVEVAID